MDTGRFGRLRELLRVLPTAIVLWVGSRFVFDLITSKPQFWTSRERFVEFLWNGAVFLPLMVFILLIVIKQYDTGNKA